jgi:hypothetical protein
MTRALLMVLALLPAAAVAQAPVKDNPPPATPPERPASNRPVLNLRLDNASSFATTNPEKEPAKSLPALGGDARSIPAPRREGSGPTPGGPFPKDTNPQH